MLETTRRIGTVWYSTQSQLQRLQESASDADFERRHRQLVLSVVERGVTEEKDGKISRGIVIDVDAVVAFFSELVICVNAGLCDGPSAHAFFDGYARRFYCLHEPYLTWKSANYSAEFGKDLARFASRDAEQCRK